MVQSILIVFFSKIKKLNIWITWYMRKRKKPSKIEGKEAYFFIFSHFDWICCDRTEGVCMYACMYVCVYVCFCVTALQPKRVDWFWWNFLQRIWHIFARSVFLGLWHIEIDDVMAAILHFFVGALSQSQFCSDFLQNCRRGKKLSYVVCFLKSER